MSRSNVSTWAAAVTGRRFLPAPWLYAATLAVAVPAKIITDSGGPDAVSWVPVVLLIATAARAWTEHRSRFASHVDAPRLVLLALGLWYLGGVGPHVGGDGLDSYVSARSLLFDRDSDVRNDYQCFAHVTPPALDGEVKPRFPVGLALLWIPPLGLTHGAVLVARLFGSDLAADGCSVPYRSAAVTSSFAFGFAGLLLLESLLRAAYSRGLAFLAVVGVWLATPLFFYMVRAPAMTHATAFAVYTLLVALVRGALRGEAPERWPPWLRVGGVVGLLVLVRPNDFVHVLLPVAAIVAVSRDRVRSLAALSAGPVVALAVQAAWWYSVFGAEFPSKIRRFGGIGARAPEVVELLFSARHGLLTWTPLYLLALVGWLLWWRRDRFWSLACAASFAVAAFQVSTTWDWWGRDAFGQRRLVTLTALFAFGVAETLRALLQRPQVLTALLVAARVFWNQQFAYIFDTQWVAPRDQPISLGPLMRAQIDVTYRRLLNAAHWMPPRLWAVLNDNLTGIWIDSGGSILRAGVQAGRDYDEFPPLFTEGWREPVRDAEGGFRFTHGRRVVLTLPVRRPADLDIQVRLRPLWLPTRVEVLVNGAPVTTWEPPAGWSTQPARLPAHTLRPGLNQLTLVLSPEPSGERVAVEPGERLPKRSWLAVRSVRIAAPSEDQ